MLLRKLNILKSNSFFLFGPRGSGKTTYLKQNFDPSKTFWIDLLNPKSEDKYLLHPEKLKEELEEVDCEWVIIDEIQKVPSLLDVVHQILEGTKKFKFALTGSSARKLKRGAANLLAGRAFVYNLYPFTYLELGEQFNLDHALSWGLLPKIIEFNDFKQKELFLDAYCHTYLKEEVVAEQLVRNVRPFRKFLEIAAQSNSEIINYSKLARQVGVDDKTVATYYEILEDTLVGFFLPAYHESLRKQFIKSPKFYLFDCGVTRALANRLHIPVEKSNYNYGKLFEQFVILETLKLNSYYNQKFQFSYFQSKDGLEIDLVLERPGSKRKFIAIKSSSEISQESIRNLISLSNEFQDTQCYCLAQVDVPSKINGVKVLPWRDGILQILEL